MIRSPPLDGGCQCEPPAAHIAETVHFAPFLCLGAAVYMSHKSQGPIDVFPIVSVCLPQHSVPKASSPKPTMSSLPNSRLVVSRLARWWDEFDAASPRDIALSERGQLLKHEQRTICGSTTELGTRIELPHSDRRRTLPPGDTSHVALVR